jgi:hypothetical protein
VRDLRCNILADMRRDGIVSPARIRRLTAENGIIARTYERFASLDGDAGRESRECAEKVRAESRDFEAMLGAWDAVIDRIEAELSAVRDADARRRLLDLRREWIAEGAARAVSACMFAELLPLPEKPERAVAIGVNTRRMLIEAQRGN